MTRAVSCAILLFVLAPRTAFSHLPPDEEIVLLTEQIRLHPEDASLLLRRGDLHRAHRDFTRARADYVSASRIDPATASLEFRLGGLELVAGDTRRAKDHLDRHLRKHPDDVQALRMRARALRDLGKPVAATRDLRRAIAAIAPPDRARPDDYLECARALAAAGPEHRDEAIRTLEDGMKVLGPIVSLQIPAIDLDVEARRFDEALGRLDARERLPGRHDAWEVRRAEILERAGRTVEARLAFRD